jgi:subtilisin family serine protease
MVGRNYNPVVSKLARSWFSHLLFTLLLVFSTGQAATAQLLPAKASQAQTRLVVRDTLGLENVLNVCKLLHCTVDHGLGDPDGQLFLVKVPTLLAPVVSRLMLNLNLGVISVELDQVVQTQGASAGPPPDYLSDRTPVNYYGSSVWRGYLTQPANELIRTDATHARFNTTGSGVVVAVIDTGVDPNHPVLKNSLLTGYDFTRNQSGGSEMSDVSQSTVAVLDNRPARVSQSTVAVLDQSTVAVLDGQNYAAFGHGTMVSGIVHLVAPQAKILPLKAFQADGTGYNSNILSAVYYAVGHGANVINMSFNYSDYSPELAKAITYARNHGVICVAAAGNDGEETTVYPAALKDVIDVASTGDNDIRSTFTNYGAPPVWLAAPGEGVMTTYPFGTYAAGWGTSFSAPLVSGTAALLVSTYNVPASTNTGISLGFLSLSASLGANVNSLSSEQQAANALSHGDPIADPQLGYGRLDTYQAVQAWRRSLGLN